MYCLATGRGSIPGGYGDLAVDGTLNTTQTQINRYTVRLVWVRHVAKRRHPVSHYVTSHESHTCNVQVLYKILH